MTQVSLFFIKQYVHKKWLDKVWSKDAMHIESFWLDNTKEIKQLTFLSNILSRLKIWICDVLTTSS